MSQSWVYNPNAIPTTTSPEASVLSVSGTAWSDLYEPLCHDLTEYIKHLHQSLPQLDQLNNLDCIRTFGAIAPTGYKSTLIVAKIVNETDPLLSVLSSDAFSVEVQGNAEFNDDGTPSYHSLDSFVALENGKSSKCSQLPAVYYVLMPWPGAHVLLNFLS